MNRLANREICERTVEEVERMAKENNSSAAAELRRLKMGHSAYSNWKSWNACPGAFALSKMAANGYDVMYILTGRRS
jgi:hypothetical protein